MESKRIVFFDYLRIISILSVIMIHVASQNWYAVDVSSHEWEVFSFYDSLVRWGVPIYVMISGALFLRKECIVKDLFLKSIFRIFIKLLFWSVVYVLWNFFIVNSIHSKMELLNQIFSGHYHLWFMYMIIGLYMIVPFLKLIVENKKLTFYFILLAFVFSFLLPQIISITSLFNTDISNILNNIIVNTKMNFVLGYSGYYVLGYLLSNTDIKRKQEIIIYVLGCLGLVSTVFMTLFFSRMFHSYVALFYDYMSINVLFTSIAIFVFAKQHKNNFSFTKKKWLTFLSKCSLGIYLVHPLVMYIFDFYFHINSLSYNPLFFVPAMSIFVFGFSIIVSLVLNRIPIVKDWIV